MGSDSNSYFVPNIHAYSDMSKCFCIFVAFSLGLGAWGLASTNTKEINNILHPASGAGNVHLGSVCSQMNSFLHFYGFTCFAEAGVTLSLGYSMLHIMKNASWGCFSLCNMSVYILCFLAKAIILTMGVIWTWGVDNVPCHTKAKDLYSTTSTYLAVALAMFGVQVIIGSVFLLLCGLMDALHEAVANIKDEWLQKEDHQFTDAAF
mmetsp:Transcript_43248/g.84766  ORF Transcript_43248/g.84766 Transcript_43248/m.84766 type:complete len:206 (+) Transcript_43248:43-660(+)|eukprot:CAMPEP_0175144274 /NCGR_PEP_ID=MMETSP0087-20121206/14022_1 /TAXON_ID=136419 /ORGANISM="Unknown Unknown, Strain D1" /LENGTH=205 /DNA_ID=CAMNT_0016428687 /DNA_START=45 /DNA_END=662 /DNA_ORIENTATION=-